MGKRVGGVREEAGLKAVMVGLDLLLAKAQVWCGKRKDNFVLHPFAW